MERNGGETGTVFRSSRNGWGASAASMRRDPGGAAEMQSNRSDGLYLAYYALLSYDGLFSAWYYRRQPNMDDYRKAPLTSCIVFLERVK